MTRPALLFAVQIATVAAILGCVLALATLHPLRLDLTPERRFTLSSHTREVLERLTEDVRITVFYSTQTVAFRRDMADLLALYAEAQPRISVRFLDLDRSPGMAKRLGVSTYNTAVVEAGERRESVELVTEDWVTSTVLAVAGTPPVPTYFVVGHGEHDPRSTDERSGASDAAQALATEGFLVRTIAGAADIPADAGLVILAGPARDLQPAELDALTSYVTRGGRLLVLTDPGTPPSVVRLLGRFGVEPAADLVVDEQGRLFGTDGRSARVAYLNQELVSRPPEVHALLPEAQSLRVVDVPGFRGDYLAMTTETTWADVDRRPTADGIVFRPGQDRRGPLPVAAIVRTGGEDTPGGVLVAVGDADFVTNLHVNMLGNRDLLLTSAELLARAEPSAAARPKTRPGGTFSPLTLTARDARTVFLGAVVAPTLVMAALALVMARRRRRA